MSVHLSHTTIDSIDPPGIARFWTELAGWEIQDNDSDDEVYLIDDNGFTTLFIRVGDHKRVKNRIHFDLRPVDSTRDAEVDRAVALGARVVDDRRNHDGWVVLADPEGNEFCILDG